MTPLILPETQKTISLTAPASATGEGIPCACKIPDSKSAACRYSEQGYLLVSVTILIMVVVSILSTVAFVSTREGRFKENFATGERLASLAPIAHAYTQHEHYINKINLTGNVFTAMNLPDNFSFTNQTNTNFSVEIIARNEMPVAGATTDKAASAYIHLRIRPKTGIRNPTDTVALQSGANRGGMGRLGFFKTSIPTGDLCDGSTTVVRWGSEADSCLNQTQSDSLFTDIQPGDIVVPAWETALIKMDRYALMRFPQPGRLDLNTMNQDLVMTNQDITGGNNFNSDTITQPATGTAALNRMIVKQNNTTQFNQPVIATNAMIVNPPAPGGVAMRVDNSVIIRFGGNVAIADTLRSGSVPLVLNVAKTISTQNIGVVTRDLIISSNTAPLNVGVKRILSPPNRITVNGPTGRLTVSGTLDTRATILNSSDVFAGRLETSNNAVIKNTGTSFVTINTPSLDQKGNINTLTAVNINIRNRCDGLACPNNSTIPDPNPPLD